MKKTLTMCVTMAALGILSIATSLFVPPPKAAEAATSVAYLQGSEAKAWGALSDGVGASEDVRVEGAAMGDFCVPSMSTDVIDVTLTCNVTAAGVATVRAQNESAGSATIASGTLYVIVFKRPSTGG